MLSSPIRFTTVTEDAANREQTSAAELPQSPGGTKVVIIERQLGSNGPGIGMRNRKRYTRSDIYYTLTRITDPNGMRVNGKGHA